MVLRLRGTSDHLDGNEKKLLGPTLRVSVSLGLGARICISNKVPGGAAAAYLELTGS